MMRGNETKDIISPLLSQTTHANHDTITIDTKSNGTHVVSYDDNLLKSITISFEKINYTIGRTANNGYCQKIFSCWKQTPNKQILFDLSGVFTPGMNAILGIYFIFLF